MQCTMTNPFHFQLHSYADHHYDSYHNATIGCDYKQKSLKVDGMNVNLGIWDTAGTRGAISSIRKSSKH